MSRTGLMVFACLIAAGCATASSVQKLYEGPDRPDTEVASVIVPYTIEIRDINGTAPDAAISMRAEKEQQLKLLPGLYVFGVRFSSPFEFGPEHAGLTTPRSDHKATLKAGHTYRFMSRVKGYNSSADVDIWIEDAGTKVRADEVPPVPAPKPIVAEPAPAPKIETGKPQSSTLDELKRSWHAATPDERAEFLKSITSP